MEDKKFQIKNEKKMAIRCMKWMTYRYKVQYVMRVETDSPQSKWWDRSFRLKTKRTWKQTKDK